jgi:hypothetical protein
MRYALLYAAASAASAAIGGTAYAAPVHTEIMRTDIDLRTMGRTGALRHRIDTNLDYRNEAGIRPAFVIENETRSIVLGFYETERVGRDKPVPALVMKGTSAFGGQVTLWGRPPQ